MQFMPEMESVEKDGEFMAGMAGRVHEVKWERENAYIDISGDEKEQETEEFGGGGGGGDLMRCIEK